MDEENSNVYFFEGCRLCLEERGYFVIFDRIELLDDIYKCTGVKISPSDNLPQRICKKCLDIVVKATKLRVIANKNDRHLRCLNDCPQDITPLEQFESSPEEKIALAKEDLTESKNSGISVRKDLFNISKIENTQNWNEVEAGSSLNLIRQMKPSHEHGDNEYKCPVCSKIFTKWKKLYIHHRLHNKCYTCTIDICGKKFATKGDLEKHIRTHTGEKPYACNNCDRSFAQRGTLKAHKESVHTCVPSASSTKVFD